MKVNKFFLATSLIVIAAIYRLLPHPPNATPVGAMALVGGLYIGRKYLAFILPLLALFLSDLVINNTISRSFLSEQTGLVIFSDYMIPVYFSFILIVGIGFILSKQSAFQKILFGTLLSSVSFFIITNFGVWLSSTGYPKNFSGLMMCYEMAIPFFRNTLLSNAIFVTLFVSIIEMVRAYQLKKQVA